MWWTTACVSFANEPKYILRNIVDFFVNMSFVNEDEVKEKLGEESYRALINAVEVKKWVYSLED